LSRCGHNKLRKILSLGSISVYQALLQIGLLPFYLNLIGLDGYGIVGFFMALQGMASVLDTAVSGAVCRQIAWLNARGVENLRIPPLVYSTEILFWAVVSFFTLLFFIFVFFFHEQWFQESDRFEYQIREISWLAGGAFLTSFPAGFYAGIMNGYEKQVHSGLLGALAQSVRSFGGLAVLMLNAADLRMFFVWNMVIGALHTMLQRKAALKCLPAPAIKTRFSWPAVKSIQKFAGGMFAITACSSLGVYADRLILSKFVSLSDYGLYVFIANLLGGMSRFVSPLIVYYNPKMAAFASTQNNKKLIESLQEFFSWICALLIPPLITFATFSNLWLVWWTGNSVFTSGTEAISFLLGAVLLLNQACYPVTSMLYANEKMKGVFKGTICAAIFTPLALLAIIPEYGSLGAAATMALIALAHFAYILWIGSKALKKNLLKFAKTLVLCIGWTCLVTFSFKTLNKNVCLNLSTLIPLFLFIMIGNFLLIYIFKKEEIHNFKK